MLSLDIRLKKTGTYWHFIYVASLRGKNRPITWSFLCCGYKLLQLEKLTRFLTFFAKFSKNFQIAKFQHILCYTFDYAKLSIREKHENKAMILQTYAS